VASFQARSSFGCSNMISTNQPGLTQNVSWNCQFPFLISPVRYANSSGFVCNVQVLVSSAP
jgi:hypothetical protein